MTTAPDQRRGIRSPRGWLGLAFLAVWLYLISQLLRIFPGGTADAFVLTLPEARQVHAITSGLGQIGLFMGLIASLWRANVAAGGSGMGMRGLAFGAAGVAIMSLFEIALIVDWLRIVSPLTPLTVSPSLDAGIITGTAVVFAGLASLGVGLARAVDLFGRSRSATVSPPAAGSEEPS